jgi:hypothetical protein
MSSSGSLTLSSLYQRGCEMTLVIYPWYPTNAPLPPDDVGSTYKAILSLVGSGSFLSCAVLRRED